MENTGRILHWLKPTARRIIFGATADASINVDLVYASQVDMAHLVMLSECGIIDRDRACKLLQAIDELRTCNFAPLRGQPAPRGLFILYENYLIQKLGDQIGGCLQTARSRNDLNSTTLRLRLRAPYLRLLREALRLQAILLQKSRKFADVVMPAYTHYQPAVPITYGHYLSGIAVALGRDIAGFVEASTELNRCPLGAGAVGGTSLPINETRTASLLGFELSTLHSIDAVASRDFILRLLSNAAILGITLSRLSADLLLWTTTEFGFLSLPDQLVGSSSMMPQKRNPFLLEHVQGRSTSALGAFVAAATAMHGKPFTNAIAVGTEGVAHIWKPLQDITEAITLARLVVTDALPQQQVMLQRAVDGYTSATELANRLVVDGGMAFRSAHHMVGAIVREAVENGGEPLQDVAMRSLSSKTQSVDLAELDPISVAQASVHGGGPGAASINNCLQALHTDWSRQMECKRKQAQKWCAAEAVLNNAIQQLCKSVTANTRKGDLDA
ncbi:MAG: argininosuccinate lyase [Rhizonema sp. PD37]|nr:argininosuccinate lyase [Rhizonema sp. PD37]